MGPVSQGVLRTELASAGGPSALVWGPGVPEWTEARHVPALGVGTKQPIQPPRAPTARRADEIDYELFGDDMQFVEITLDPDEVVIAEAGAMMYMTEGIEMQTV
ncbi:MAG: AIM24 family protein, partial [Planctomycetes bacterium]|nr:AIM24 family protein [Planctomycetota bacterium]